MNVQGYKLLLYVVTNDGDDWETPNALVIPVNSEDFKLTLAYIRRIFPLPGNYHFRTRYKHGSGYVWLDLTREDEVLQCVDNVLYMKILRLSNEPKRDKHEQKVDLLSGSKAKKTDFDLIYLSRSNTAKIAQYVDRVIHLGKRNLLFRVDVKHLYSIWNLCKNEEEYRYALTATNHFYNFGRQLSPEAIDKLFVTMLRCGQVDEAIEMISGTRNWARSPPSLNLIYLLLNELMSQREFEKVFKVYKSVRMSWQIPLTRGMYETLIGYMLTTEENPVEEAIMIYGDSEVMGVRLSEETHCQLLERTLELVSDDEMCREMCTYIRNRMCRELESFHNPKTYYLLSWLKFRYKEERETSMSTTITTRTTITTSITTRMTTHKEKEKDWKQLLEEAVHLSLLSEKGLSLSKAFTKELGPELESLKVADIR